jgi:RND family efflux transporter MFP subunit
LTLRQKVALRRIAAGTAIGGALLLLTLKTALSDPTEPEAGFEPGVLVETVTAKEVTSFEVQRTFAGLVAARRASDVGFERAGRLVEVLVDEGDRVGRGQPLAQLDTRNLEAKRRELSAHRAQAAAVLAELVAGPRAETIAAARAEARDLDSQAELQKVNYARRRKLREGRVISQEEYDQAAFGAQAAEARAEAAQRRLDELLAGARKEQVDAQRAAIAGLEAALADVEVNLAESTLLAPFAGEIAARHLDEGAIVGPNTPVLRVVEGGQREARIGLPPSTAALLRPSDTLRVIVAGKPYNASVAAVLPELDVATRTQTAVLRIETDDDCGPSPGQIARIDLTDRNQNTGYWLPSTALARGGRGLWSVYAVVSAKRNSSRVNRAERLIVERRDVEVLHTTGERVLVRGTLSEGEQIVSAGLHRITPGQTVSLKTGDNHAAGPDSATARVSFEQEHDLR